ncbi:hypothetical protein ASPZODRAFT_126449 [Penicilliopsis zonata CBS 506.65]|uniref:SGNH hydrolase-type esterase domain-containing protein n=1 Tax=Penicilliopsis zonata CBS 506.65 TaxID=1073090 RepID=A0A1L9STW9_9EURO|nr:hypothetical protein ASPZODRAFT_126449 [Penicilliopsis zonata CBS 506.65]OJJ50564.1 hypothetical protein ASPZODRAFT_126449 [Penicilliopsis zonata CBS 506.65]
MSSVTEEGLYQPYDQFILFGDSITEGSSSQELGFAFHAALQDAYRRRLDVINRGFSGYSTAHAIKVFPKFFPRPETATVRFMTIFFGANDACLQGNVQHVPLEDYKRNLRTIIEHPATKAQNPKIIMLTPPPVNEYQLKDFDASKEQPHPSRTASHTKEYADAARQLASELGIPTADIWTAFMTAAGWQQGQPLTGSTELPNNDKLASLLTDGLHFTPAGYQIVYDEVMKTIRAHWPEQTPESLPMIYPGWTEAPK